MILRSATIQTILGIAIGIPTALFCVRFVKSQLYEIASADLNIVIGSVAVLSVATLVAAIIPARRAAVINPMNALRMD